jgi:5'-3' exonuclease
VVGERVVVVDRMRKRRYSERDIGAKFGVPPCSIPDFLALVGDTADGIPGVPGWGEKSAAAVLAAYGDVASIPASDADWMVKIRGARRLADNLAALREEVELYRVLATLRTDVPLGVGVDDLKWPGPDAALVARLAVELDDPQIVELARSARDKSGA